MSTDEVNPHDTAPVPIAPPPPATAPAPSPGGPAYSRFEVRHYADTAGRAFTMLVNRDGQPDRFTAAGVFEKAYPDHTGGRQGYQIAIPATCVDSAFEKFDAAKAAAEKDAEAELDHQHMVAALTNQLPGPPPPQGVPLDIARGRKLPKRLIH